MFKKPNNLFLAVALLLSALTTAAYAHETNSRPHESSVVSGSKSVVTISIRPNKEATVTSSEHKLRHHTHTIAKANSRAMSVVFDEGAGCLRPNCGCSKTSHGNPACYANRGDCPNHEGIACIWDTNPD